MELTVAGVVERTFAWMGRNRRLAKDFEKIVETSMAYLEVAMIQLMIGRLARSLNYVILFQTDSNSGDEKLGPKKANAVKITNANNANIRSWLKNIFLSSQD